MTGQAFSFPSQGYRMAAAAVSVTSPINKCSFLTISKIVQVSLFGPNCHMPIPKPVTDKSYRITVISSVVLGQWCSDLCVPESRTC